MTASHTPVVATAAFDEPNLIGSTGLVPLMALADAAGLIDLADEYLSLPTHNGANAGLKVASLIAGMATGADSIDDMAVLRHGALPVVLPSAYAPSTLGCFLRSFTFGHVRQLDAVASRVTLALADTTPLLGPASGTDQVMLDVDDTIIEVHGHTKQGAAFGYSKVRGLNALLATVSTTGVAPVIVAQRLRKGNTGSSRGATRLVTDALALLRRTHLAGRETVVRADSAFYNHGFVTAVLTTGAHVSVTVRIDPAVRKAIATIDEGGWSTIRYPQAIYDESTHTWISNAQVAEIPYTAFSSKKLTDQVPGRLVVRRIPELNPKKYQGQDTLFATWRFHAFFTTTPATDLDTVTADQVHRRHAIIENVHADLKASALAHLPSKRMNANAAWLVCAVMTFNLTRAAASLTDSPALAKATTATIRRTLLNVPARLATSARRQHLHLPTHWPWQHPWTHPLPGRPRQTTSGRGSLTTQPDPGASEQPTWKSRADRQLIHAPTAWIHHSRQDGPSRSIIRGLRLNRRDPKAKAAQPTANPHSAAPAMRGSWSGMTGTATSSSAATTPMANEPAATRPMGHTRRAPRTGRSSPGVWRRMTRACRATPAGVVAEGAVHGQECSVQR
jgi:DDE family transposase